MRKTNIFLIPILVLASLGLGVGVLQSQKSSDSDEVAARVAAAAQEFLDALDQPSHENATFAFNDEERKDWSNLPYPFYERQGISVGEMSDEARVAAHRLFQSVLSSQGYLKVTGIMYLDDVLAEISSFRTEDGRMPFGSDFYWMGVFGTPAPDSVWGWQLDGHHLALNVTVVGDEIAVTPTFMGSDPAEVRVGPNSGWRILGTEDDLGLQLIGALDESQQARAVLADSARSDVFAGPGRADALKTISGLPAADMTPEQRGMLMRLMEEYVHNLNDDLASEYIERVQRSGIDGVHFAWMGPVNPGPFDRYYYRIHGERILIEFDNAEPPGQAGAKINHIHTVFRDPSNDYGEDMLKKHYEESGHH